MLSKKPYYNVMIISLFISFLFILYVMMSYNDECSDNGDTLYI